MFFSVKFFLHLSLICGIVATVVGMWHSLVARLVRDEEAAGSNPVIPTIFDNEEPVCPVLFLYINAV